MSYSTTWLKHKGCVFTEVEWWFSTTGGSPVVEVSTTRPPLGKVMVEGHRWLPPFRRSDDITTLRVAIYWQSRIFRVETLLFKADKRKFGYNAGYIKDEYECNSNKCKCATFDQTVIGKFEFSLLTNRTHSLWVTDRIWPKPSFRRHCCIWKNSSQIHGNQ